MTDEKFVDPVFRVSLLVCAFVFCLAVFGVILPGSWIEFILGLTTGRKQAHQLFSFPFTIYLIRTMCVAYFWIGIYFYMIARDPAHRMDMAKAGIAMLAALGLVCMIAGYLGGLHPHIYLADALPSIAGAVILYRLLPKNLKNS